MCSKSSRELSRKVGGDFIDVRGDFVEEAIVDVDVAGTGFAVVDDVGRR